jgi:hypothetical protein
LLVPSLPTYILTVAELLHKQSDPIDPMLTKLP